MIAVSDASPLINLARIDQLGLLRQLYGELHIPDAVWNEIVVHGAGLPGAEEVRAATWIQTHMVTNQSLVRALRQELDAGEAEAIALALELQADVLVMDELLGRQTSEHMGLHLVGLIGVLIDAKRLGFLVTIRPHLDAVRHTAGFRVSDGLYERVLRDIGEL